MQSVPLIRYRRPVNASASIFGTLIIMIGVSGLCAEGTDVTRVGPADRLPDDARLGEPRTTRDAFHPWNPPETRSEWEMEAKRLRDQVRVATGLWPMPPKSELKPVVHGPIDRGDYTIEKVYFESHPGHYVTGNLYRPARRGGEGPFPGILSPHGHWQGGRFYERSIEEAKEEIDQGAESFMAGARYPLQARMAQVARMGYVVFHYDMVGYGDNRSIEHRQGFTDVQAALRLQSTMGLQTFNSIRALDFLTSLPRVDPERIGVTGASGGGTQTFILGAVDPRPRVAFPAVMVSTGMQGGCVCENAAYLRRGINNIALAALFAPKPQAMTGADDWTLEIESKGLPELKQVYGLYGRAHHVEAKAFPEFQHNYNEVSREVMYDWFDRHLTAGTEGGDEQSDFWPVEPEALRVWDEAHQRPEDSRTAAELREYLTRVADRQFRERLPESRDEVADYKETVGRAARVMLDEGIPAEVTVDEKQRASRDSWDLRKGYLRRPRSGEAVPYLTLMPDRFQGTAVLWFDGHGKARLFEGGRPRPEVRELLDAGVAVASADLFLTGEFVRPGHEPAYPEVHEEYPGYTFAYNRPVVSNRVRDVLTALGAWERQGVQRIHLIGTGRAGPWVLLARGLAGESVDHTVVDLQGFQFKDVRTRDDPMLLPGALKYGGIGGLAALAAPAPLTIMGVDRESPEIQPLLQVYRAAEGSLTLKATSLNPSQAISELDLK